MNVSQSCNLSPQENSEESFSLVSVRTKAQVKKHKKRDSCKLLTQRDVLKLTNLAQTRFSLSGHRIRFIFLFLCNTKPNKIFSEHKTLISGVKSPCFVCLTTYSNKKRSNEERHTHPGSEGMGAGSKKYLVELKQIEPHTK